MILPCSPPYCSVLSILLSYIIFVILSKIILSYTFSMISINAIGLVLVISYKPSSVLGIGFSSVWFHDEGTCLPCSIWSITFAISSKFSSSSQSSISTDTVDGPGVLPTLNDFIPSLTSFIHMVSLTVSHMPSSFCNSLYLSYDSLYAVSISSLCSSFFISLVSIFIIFSHVPHLSSTFATPPIHSSKNFTIALATAFSLYSTLSPCSLVDSALVMCCCAWYLCMMLFITGLSRVLSLLLNLSFLLCKFILIFLALSYLCIFPRYSSCNSTHASRFTRH